MINTYFLPKLPTAMMVQHIMKSSMFNRYTWEDNIKMELVRYHDMEYTWLRIKSSHGLCLKQQIQLN